MTRKLVLFSSLILIAITVIGLILSRSVQGLEINTSDDAQAIKETILRARRIWIEAEYSFDTSQFISVYINDPRGGELSDEALAQIREIRHDSSLRKDQVGLLDYEITLIEKLKHDYENYIEELQVKKESGILTDQENIILNGEIYGWSTPTPEIENPAQMATQACVLFLAQATAYWETATALPIPEIRYMGYGTAYPGPPTPSPLPATMTPVSGTAYPGPERESMELFIIPCPTLNPTPRPINVPIRGADPATLSHEEFNIDIYSIEIEGNIAKAIVHKR